jgi:hypothetical protein
MQAAGSAMNKVDVDYNFPAHSHQLCRQRAGHYWRSLDAVDFA